MIIYDYQSEDRAGGILLELCDKNAKKIRVWGSGLICFILFCTYQRLIKSSDRPRLIMRTRPRQVCYGRPKK